MSPSVFSNTEPQQSIRKSLQEDKLIPDKFLYCIRAYLSTKLQSLFIFHCAPNRNHNKLLLPTVLQIYIALEQYTSRQKFEYNYMLNSKLTLNNKETSIQQKASYFQLLML